MIEKLKGITASNVPVKEVLAVSKCEYKPFKQKAGYFLTCDLSDKTGTIKGIVWDGAEVLKTWLRDRMVIEIVGELTRYNDVHQIVIKTLKKQDVFDPADFIHSLDPDKIEELYNYLVRIKNSIKSPLCHQIWNLVLFGSISKKFIKCPGGIGDVHHNYLGGLLEHSASIVRMADDLTNTQPSLDRDLLLTGSLIHDIGKIEAYTWGVILEMADKGRLLHHIYTGLEILHDMDGEEMSQQDSQMLLKLKHIMASHHEGAESAVKPMIPEALVVSGLDGLDAVTNHSTRWIADPERQKPDENWTTYCQLTGRFYYNPKDEGKKDIPVVEENTFSPKKEDSIY